MTTITRFIAPAILCAGILGAATLGVAGTANAANNPAAPTTTTAPAPVGPGYQYSPDSYASPAPGQLPGWNNHHGPGHMN